MNINDNMNDENRSVEQKLEKRGQNLSVLVSYTTKITKILIYVFPLSSQNVHFLPKFWKNIQPCPVNSLKAL